MNGPQIDAIGIAVSDMAVAIAFYRRLGLDFPPDAESEPHAEATLGPSMRLMLDTEAMLRQIDPEWSATPGGRLGLAVRLPDPSALDSLYAELSAEGSASRSRGMRSGVSDTPLSGTQTGCTSISTPSCQPAQRLSTNPQTKSARRSVTTAHRERERRQCMVTKIVSVGGAL